MSAAFGFVKFLSTGNIYYCYYNGTSDILVPYICTPEECKTNDGFYSSLSYIENHGGNWVFPNVEDVDDVEIYSDYGSGFYWKGIGSESVKMIKSPLMPFEQCYEEITRGKPDWVSKFLNE